MNELKIHEAARSQETGYESLENNPIDRINDKEIGRQEVENESEFKKDEVDCDKDLHKESSGKVIFEVFCIHRTGKIVRNYLQSPMM